MPFLSRHQNATSTTGPSNAFNSNGQGPAIGDQRHLQHSLMLPPQGELQKSRKTSTEAHSLNCPTDEIHDALEVPQIVVDGIEHIVDVKEALCATLFGTLNSEKWRSHIVKDKLKLMEYFANLPKDSEPFTACKKNASILPWLRSRVDEGGEKGEEETKLWLAILWSDYTNLPEDVRDQVLEVTKAAILGVRHDVSFISRIMAAEKERYQAMLDGHKAASLEDEPERLRAKVEGLNEGIEKFAQVVGEKAKQ
ncbi:hypothetical protein BDM02DRAFT_3273551 [Thelephora ganbajun]|uniref:Uncharacterized protein n=1 Tax=Thelephora ganbajun TaxID=370292 RepID=A0ACB6YXR0_THEGA|nr:hypothetical protein BDM02DRAFT_3273551 [Thelephora ganbajun]